MIDRDKEVYGHALASTTCLLSGLEVFNVGYSHQDRMMRVLKGLHGFHVYANKYWVDYVLNIFSSNSQQQVCKLTTTLQNLSNALDMLGGLSEPSKIRANWQCQKTALIASKSTRDFIKMPKFSYKREARRCLAVYLGKKVDTLFNHLLIQFNELTCNNF